MGRTHERRRPWLLPPGRAREFLLTQRRYYDERRATYVNEEPGFALVEDEVDDPSSPYFAQYATLRYGMMRASDTIAWCDWLLDRLESSSSPHPRTGLNRAED